ncbi:pilus assembly protein TadG-related protein [Sulfitobacter sp. F26169L]|uniref:pilus assembly protein TadG-related protein n=1 Tax=Sulfitobacter sp. F26169L TaxID=2996015 RepID=UPI002260FE0D|nr:pilus assembly protein TadG-related protein [Sulfitobacter sp. F26169L]MCX7566435.1 pilus assembly protein TadG-related protein [Sulfitobacter sp. F26169L]
MKKLFSTTCIPFSAGFKKSPLLRHFAYKEEGNVTILSLALIAALGLLAGIAWDMNSHEFHRVKIQHTADAAVLAAADLDQLRPPQEVVKDYFEKAGYPDLVAAVTVDNGMNYRTVSVDVGGLVEAATIGEEMDGQVILNGNAYLEAKERARQQNPDMTEEELVAAVEQTFSTETKFVELNAFAEAEERINNVEISMVLDISGSMGWGDNKMKNLRDAASVFVDTVIRPETEDLVSLSIVPYSENVSAGPEIMNEMNINWMHSYSNCVEFDDSDFNDTTISQSQQYDQVQHFYWGGSTYRNSLTNPVCLYGDDESIVAFSQDTTELKRKIGQLEPRGNTSIFLGMKWAAALLDPSFKPINAAMAANGDSDPVFSNRPVAFEDRETLKTVILMTDGQNTSSYRIPSRYYANYSHRSHWNRYNLDYYIARYWNRPSSELKYTKYWGSKGDNLLSSVCTAAKAKNIVIWSIGFEVEDHGANVMRDCASSPSHFFRVEGVEIQEAFKAIARQINQLRLTQ